MTRPVGYYVHHQGEGHWQRACRIGRALGRPCTLLGTFAGIDTASAPGPLVALPDDRLSSRCRFDGEDGEDGEAQRPQSLHYAPLGHPGIRARMARIAAWIAETDPVLVIVDVSVEVALLCRLLSVPTLVMRLAGNRTDPPHLEAFRSATRLIAPFPRAVDVDTVPDWVEAKTLYAGFLGACIQPVSDGTQDGRIVVVFGRGGAGGDVVGLAQAARAVRDRDWHVLGPVHGADAARDRPPNLHLHGWVADVDAHLARASLVVGGGGDGVVAAVASAGRRFVCLPEPRPYDEQVAKADALARIGAAVVCRDWPSAEAWPEIVRAALALDPAVITGLFKRDAVERLAATIEATAGRLEDEARPGA